MAAFTLRSLPDLLEHLDLSSGATCSTWAAATASPPPSGGQVFICGYHVSDDETEGLYSARLSLYLNVLASGQGMAYPARDYRDWLRRTGFSRVSITRGLAYEHGLTTGVKD